MNIPEIEIQNLPPVVKETFLQWDTYMFKMVEFSMPGSEIHTFNHCERVLLFALIIGEKTCGEDKEALEILAHAAVFHDTRRQDDYLDTGHGARAAVYYEQFCNDNSGITFHPESVYLMRFHDLDDPKGVEAIRNRFGKDSERVLKLYEIFKDSDALDRWRLGKRGLDPQFLRTSAAKNMTEYSRRIVKETVPAEQLKKIEKEVERIIQQQN